VFTSIFILAEENEENIFYNQTLEIGTGFYSASVSGFIVKYWLTNKFGIAFSIFPQLTFENGAGGLILGDEFDYRFKTYEFLAPYIYIGGNVNIDFDWKSTTINNGFGFGFQLVLYKHFDIQFHIGFGIYDNFSEFLFAGGAVIYFSF